MRLYETLEETITEWQRELSARFNDNFIRYIDDNETINRWSERLTYLLGKPFYVYEDLYETLKEWSNLI